LEYNNQEENTIHKNKKEKLQKEIDEELIKHQIVSKEIQGLNEDMEALKLEEGKLNQSIINEKQILLRDFEDKNSLMISQVYNLLLFTNKNI